MKSPYSAQEDRIVRSVGVSSPVNLEERQKNDMENRQTSRTNVKANRIVDKALLDGCTLSLWKVL